MVGKTTVQDKIVLLDIEKCEIVTIARETGAVLSVIPDAGHVDGLQIDAAAGYIYWTDMGAHMIGDGAPDPDGAIYRARLDGSEKVTLFGNGALYTPKQLQLDPASQTLYWCDRESGRVMCGKTDGSAMQTLVERGHGDSYPRDPLDWCVGVAIDPVRGKIYWTQKGTPKGGKGRLYRASLVLPAGESPWARSDIETLMTGLPEPIDLLIDFEADLLYWTDRGAPPAGNSLNRAKITDAGLEGYEVLLGGFDEAIGLAMVGPENVIYVADLSGTVYRCDLKSREKTALYTGGERITGITLL